MSFKAISGLVPEWFEPERWDVDEKGKLNEVELPEGVEPTRIKIKPLTGSEFFDVLQNPGGAGIKAACRLGVVGWENFNDADGAPVEFGRQKINELIPPKYQLVIGTKIISISSFDGEKTKNS